MSSGSASAMLHGVLRNQPPFLIPVLFWTAALLSTCCLAIDSQVRAILKLHWRLIVTLSLATLFWRLSPDGRFFHGLEYEDSYVYTVSARQMLEHVGPPPGSQASPYSISTCAVGSLISCQEWESFPEHFIGYPYGLAVLYRLAGYTPDRASVLNVVAACFVCALIFLVAIVATGSVLVAGASSLVFAITPVFAVYGLETSAEPASNTCMILVLWFYMRFIVSVHNSERYFWRIVFWSAFTSALLFALTVKRENIVLAIALPILFPFLIPRTTTPALRRRVSILLMFLTLTFALLLSVEMGLWQTTGSEVDLAKTYPLTAGRLASFLLGFARSFLVLKWYLAEFLAVAVGIAVSMRRRGLSLVPLALFCCYFMVYALHIRSYYEMRAGNVEAFSALRFSMNMMCLWSLLAGIGIGAGVAWGRATRVYAANSLGSRIAVYCLLATLAVASFGLTQRLRSDAVEDEAYVRLSPAQSALRFAA